jgi:hypothetical protein
MIPPYQHYKILSVRRLPQQISTSLATVLYRAIRSVASKQDRQKTLNKQKGPYYKCFFFDKAKGR